MTDGSGGNFWTAFPSILWTGLIGIGVYCFRRELTQILNQLLLRLRAGAPMKIGTVEIGAIQTAQLQTPPPIADSIHSLEIAANADQIGPAKGVDIDLDIARNAYYSQTRKLMLVHRLFRSTKPDQVYDVLIYLTPHREGSLAGVIKAEYYFGRYWGYKTFESLDRSRGFPVLTSAYGTFLCACRIRFNDGTEEVLYRYIDFEMGAYAPLLSAE